MHGEKPNHQKPQQAEGVSEQKVQVRRSYEGNERVRVKRTGSSGRRKQICREQLCFIPSKTGQKNSCTFVAEAPRPRSYREALLPEVWCSCSVYTGFPLL